MPPIEPVKELAGMGKTGYTCRECRLALGGFVIAGGIKKMEAATVLLGGQYGEGNCLLFY